MPTIEEAFTEIRDAAVADARELFERDGKILPIMFMFQWNEDREKFSQAMLPLNTMDKLPKDVIAAILKDLTVKLEADAIIMVIEGWALQGPAADKQIAAPTIQIKDHPDHYEVVNVIAEARWGAWQYMAKITRQTPGDESSKGTLEAGEWHEQSLPEGESPANFVGFFRPDN